MVVYADVLIVLNLFVNFFILKLTALICKDGCSTARLILGGLIGALFSLYIFLPTSSALIETIFRLAMTGVIILTCFGFDSLKSYIRRIAVFFAASFIYAGCMMGIWSVFRPEKLAINNGIVYVDISPIVLIIATVTSYIILSIIRFFSTKHAYSGKRCKLIITMGDRIVRLTALVDTGHSLTDTLTDRPVLIVEEKVVYELLSFIPTPEVVASANAPIKGFRMIPYSSIGGHGLLPAFEPDKIELYENGSIKKLNKMLIAASHEPLGEDYKAIISPTVF